MADMPGLENRKREVPPCHLHLIVAWALRTMSRSEATYLNLCRIANFGAQQWFKKCPFAVQVAGDECPILVRLGAWRDKKGRVGIPKKLKHL